MVWIINSTSFFTTHPTYITQLNTVVIADWKIQIICFQIFLDISSSVMYCVHNYMYSQIHFQISTNLILLIYSGWLCDKFPPGFLGSPWRRISESLRWSPGGSQWPTLTIRCNPVSWLVDPSSLCSRSAWEGLSETPTHLQTLYNIVTLRYLVYTQSIRDTSLKTCTNKLALDLIFFFWNKVGGNFFHYKKNVD